MEMQAVKSDAVKKMGWEASQLHVEFQGGIKGYYENIPHDLYETIRTAKSIGHALFEFVKKYPDLYPWIKEVK